MKKIYFTTFLFIFSTIVFGQGLKYAGHYEGAIKSDSAEINISIDLLEDSTYRISVNYAFGPQMGMCGKGEQSYFGKWLRRKDLVYFNSGDNHFPFMDLWQSSIANEKMLEKNYAYPLKVIPDKTGGAKICFHFAHDCFEAIWDDNSVMKIIK